MTSRLRLKELKEFLSVLADVLRVLAQVAILLQMLRH